MVERALAGEAERGEARIHQVGAAYPEEHVKNKSDYKYSHTINSLLIHY